jgi:hypothetical protein
MVPGIGLRQLLRAEHLHGMPETDDLRRIIRHIHYHPDQTIFSAQPFLILLIRHSHVRQPVMG